MRIAGSLLGRNRFQAPWRLAVTHRITENCITCGACIGECPEGAIIEGEGHDINRIDAEKCTDCGRCTTEFFCPSGAIEEE